MALPKPPAGQAKPSTDVSPADALTPFIESTFTRSDLNFYLNGHKTRLENPNPHWTLLDFIRAQNGLKGTKLGCGEGGCGACTVVLQSYNHRLKRIQHLAVNACLFPLIGIDGKHVVTVEGIGSVHAPHPLQERIAKLHGSQCGFCTPGIVMSLYALIRNAYDPVTKLFRLSERDIELDGHLDGNLCRCTGYKPILHAAKTFITEDLKGKVFEEAAEQRAEIPARDLIESKATNYSCGRPGGCCRDEGSSSKSCSSSESDSLDDKSNELATTSSNSTNGTDSTEISDSSTSGATYALPMKSRENNQKGGDSDAGGVKTKTQLDTPLAPSSHGQPKVNLAPYIPSGEVIFPPGLFKYERWPLCYGTDRKIWFRPTSLDQLVSLKNAYPSLKLVGGASEIQVEIRFKNLEYSVSVYISDIPELQWTNLGYSEAQVNSMSEVVVGANTPLTELEAEFKAASEKLGPRASVLGALHKQLRYFGGRQIRNVASLAGNIATASPISDCNPVLLASGSYISCKSKANGETKLPISDLFTAYRTTTIPPDAVITRIHIPLPAKGTREITKSYKQAKRKDDDIAIVTTGCRVRLTSEGLVEDVCIAYGGMAPTTIAAKQTVSALQGRRWFEADTLEAGLTALLKDFDLQYTVPGAMSHYRKTLALSLFFRFWHESILDLNLGDVDPEIVREIEREISDGARDNYNPLEQTIVGKQVPHLSALKQCTGEAEYVDDMPRQERELFGGLVLSRKAHAKLSSVDWEPALKMPGVHGYIDKNSIPKEVNIWGSIVKDETFFADGKVESHGHIIGMVYAESALEAQKAAQAVAIEYEELPAIMTIDEAIAAGSYFPWDNELKKGAAAKGQMDEVFKDCYKTFEGKTRIGGQEHFYLETNAALVIPHSEDGSMEIWSSTQNCMETQEFVSLVTGVPSNRINARVKRMGGAFGGKESRSVPFAALLAIAAKKEKRPMRLMLNRDEDMMTSGQRHPCQARWKVGVSKDGILIALDVDLYDNAGFSQDMSAAVMGRMATHIENCYEIPHVHVRGHVCKTNCHSNTAFRGFGGPQAMYFTETIMSTIAEDLKLDIDELRLKNLYKEGDYTPFLQKIDVDWHIPTMIEQIKSSSDYDKRKAEIKSFNSKNKWKKRGICLIPTKFGLSFATALHLNQAGAYIKIYQDGSVLLHHGGTEMGQGLYTKMVQVAAQELGVPMDAVYTQDSQSYQIANASPTAASSGSDLNGMAVKNACDQINARLAPYRSKLGPSASFKQIIKAAYFDRVNLAANGFWKMPRIGFTWGNYDPNTQTPMYYYFTQGVAVTSCELDLLTGHHTVLRTDILMDVGNSINPAIDYGQIEGAFVQGQGLFTTEESLWTRDGRLATLGPGNYKIPGFSDIPQTFNVAMLRHGMDGEPLTWKHLRSVQSSKGIGEPPLFLGATVFFALRECVRAAREMNGVNEPLVMDSPATVERLRLSVGDRLSRMAEVERKDGEKEFFIKVA